MKKVLTVVIAVLLIAVSTLPAFAAISPTAKPVDYHVVVDSDEGITFNATADTEILEDGSQQWTLTAHSSEFTKFTGWTINGPYTLLEGSLTDEVIVIKVTGDTEVRANGEPIVPGTSAPVEDTTGSTDSTSATSASEGQQTPTKGGSSDGGSSDGGSTEKTIDKGGKSPQTGSSDSVVFIILGLSAAAAIAGVITAKRRSSDK